MEAKNEVYLMEEQGEEEITIELDKGALLVIKRALTS